MNNFTSKEFDQMEKEGWGLFEIDGDPDNIELQKCDELNLFETDQDAINFVKERVDKGSMLHEKALKVIK